MIETAAAVIIVTGRQERLDSHTITRFHMTDVPPSINDYGGKFMAKYLWALCTGKWVNA
jgi:hypothetical protein